MNILFLLNFPTAWSFAHSGIEHHGSLGGEVLDEPTFSEGGFLKLPKYTLPASEEGEGIVLDVRWYDVSLYNSYVNLFNPNETKNATVAGLQAEEGALKSIKWYYPQGCPADYPYAINWEGKGAWFCYSWDCSDKSDGGTYHCGSAPWRNGIDMVHLCRPPAETPLPSPNVTDSFGKTRASYWPQKVRIILLENVLHYRAGLADILLLVLSLLFYLLFFFHSGVGPLHVMLQKNMKQN